MISFNDAFLSDTEADDLFDALQNLPWTRGSFRGHPVPWEEVWMGPYPYKFSGRVLTPVPWTLATTALVQKIQKQYGASYNSALLNRYIGGQDSVAWHGDDEPEMDSKHPIASISLGAARQFKFRLRGQSEIQEALLTHGSLLIMPAGFQQAYLHCVPKTSLPCGVRVNLTFRPMM